jgi:hypothetical protein
MPIHESPILGDILAKTIQMPFGFVGRRYSTLCSSRSEPHSLNGVNFEGRIRRAYRQITSRCTLGNRGELN